MQMTYDLRYVTHKPKNLVLTDSGLGISSDLEIQVVPLYKQVFNDYNKQRNWFLH